MTCSMAFAGSVALMAALLLPFAIALDTDYDYSNEYDDVRPHLEYPDVPRLDKRLSQAAQDLTTRMEQAWHSLVESLGSAFEQLQGLFSEQASPDRARQPAVVS